MNSSSQKADNERVQNTTEFLILPTGTILVHNLTPEFAAILTLLNPSDDQIAPRVSSPELLPASESREAISLNR